MRGSSNQACELLALIAGDPRRMACLEAVAGLGLPDGWIGSGFVRAPLWDRLHGLAEPTPLGDIDVVYFDPDDTDPARDAVLEARLEAVLPMGEAGPPWSVRNQACMHMRNGDAPYRSSEDALCHWLETTAVVAVRLGDEGRPELLAPLRPGRSFRHDRAADAARPRQAPGRLSRAAGGKGLGGALAQGSHLVGRRAVLLSTQGVGVSGTL